MSGFSRLRKWSAGIALVATALAFAWFADWIPAWPGERTPRVESGRSPAIRLVISPRKFEAAPILELGDFDEEDWRIAAEYCRNHRSDRLAIHITESVWADPQSPQVGMLYALARLASTGQIPLQLGHPLFVDREPLRLSMLAEIADLEGSRSSRFWTPHNVLSLLTAGSKERSGELSQDFLHLQSAAHVEAVLRVVDAARALGINPFDSPAQGETPEQRRELLKRLEATRADFGLPALPSNWRNEGPLILDSVRAAATRPEDGKFVVSQALLALHPFLRESDADWVLTILESTDSLKLIGSCLLVLRDLRRPIVVNWMTESVCGKSSMRRLGVLSHAHLLTRKERRELFEAAWDTRADDEERLQVIKYYLGMEGSEDDRIYLLLKSIQESERGVGPSDFKWDDERRPEIPSNLLYRFAVWLQDGVLGESRGRRRLLMPYLRLLPPPEHGLILELAWEALPELEDRRLIVRSCRFVETREPGANRVLAIALASADTVDEALTSVELSDRASVNAIREALERLVEADAASPSGKRAAMLLESAKTRRGR